MKYLLLALFASSGLFAFEGTSPFCEVKKAVETKKIKINTFPEYFFKVSPDGENIGYIENSGNKLLSLEDGSSYPLPGRIDPVFTPDGKYISIPVFPYEHGGNLSFSDKLALTEAEKLQNSELSFYNYNIFKNASKNEDWPTKLEMKTQHSSAIFRDTRSFGAYQSIGVVGNNKYRVITDQAGVTLRDYSSESKDKFAANGKFYKPCENISHFPTKLPMLSRDGKFISVFDEEGTGTTKIYSINKEAKCNLAVDLGIPTGKVSFDYDNQNISFHIDHFKKQDGKQFVSTSANSFKDVYVVKIKTEKNEESTYIRPLQWAKISQNSKRGDSSYYPDFDKAGDLYYLQDIDNQFEFVKVNKKNFDFKEYNSFPYQKKWTKISNTGCFEIPIEDEKNVSLALLWKEVCQNFVADNIEDQEIMALSLDQNSCKELVMKRWTQKVIDSIKLKNEDKFDLDFLASINPSDLMAACPESVNEEEKPKVLGSWNNKKEKDFKQVFQQKCMGCHSGPLKYQREEVTHRYFNEKNEVVHETRKIKDKTLAAFNPENITEEDIAKMMNAIGSPEVQYRMPKGGTLTNEEINLFYEEFARQELSSNSGDIKIKENVFYLDKYSKGSVDSMISNYKKRELTNLEGRERNRKLYEYTLEVNCRYRQIKCDKYMKRKLRYKTEEYKGNLVKFEEYKKNLQCELGVDIEAKDCE